MFIFHGSKWNDDPKVFQRCLNQRGNSSAEGETGDPPQTTLRHLQAHKNFLGWMSAYHSSQDFFFFLKMIFVDGVLSALVSFHELFICFFCAGTRLFMFIHGYSIFILSYSSYICSSHVFSSKSCADLDWAGLGLEVRQLKQLASRLAPAKPARLRRCLNGGWNSKMQTDGVEICGTRFSYIVLVRVVLCVCF